MPEYSTPHDRTMPDDECREVLEDLQAFLDAECVPDLEQSIRIHLRECSPCLNRADFQVELKALIASKCSERAPSGLVEKVLGSLRAASRTSSTGRSDLWSDG